MNGLTATPPEARSAGTRLGSWTIDGATAQHRLEVVWAVLASSRIQVWLDGELVLTLARPRGLKPIVTSEPAMVDGRHLVVYVETADGGVTMRADAICDGVSLTSGQPATPPAVALPAEPKPPRPHWLARDIVPTLVGILSVVVIAVADRGWSTFGLVASACIVAGDVGLYRGVVAFWPRLDRPGWSPARIAATRAAVVLGWALVALTALTYAVVAVA